MSIFTKLLTDVVLDQDDDGNDIYDVDIIIPSFSEDYGIQFRIDEVLSIGQIENLENVNTSSIANNHFLVYDDSSSKWVNKQPSDALSSLGLTATAAEINYLDITTLGTLEASKVVTANASGDIIIPDSDKLQFGDSLDMTLYHDGTDSYITNQTGALKIATETSGVAITLGHTTSEVIVSDNLTVAGNLTVNGTTTTVNSTVTTLDDPIITLGGDSAPGSDDNKDRGIEFRWHNGSAAKVGFFGYDDSTSNFTFIPDATNSSEVFSGTAGNVAFGSGEFTGNVTIDNGNLLRLSELDTNGPHAISIKAPDSVSSDVTLVLPDGIGSDGQALVTNNSGVLRWESVSGFKTYNTKTGDFDAAVNNHYSVSTASGALIASLPQISTTTAGESLVIKFKAGTNTLTINPYSGNTIEGLQNLIMTDSQSPGQSITFVSDGSSAWEII